MFSRVFQIIMTPAMVLSSLLAVVIYLYFGISMLVNGDTGAAIFWFLIWGHILSALAATIITIPLLAILAVFAAAAAGMFSLAFGLQKKGVESLPFKVERKGDEQLTRPWSEH